MGIEGVGPSLAAAAEAGDDPNGNQGMQLGGRYRVLLVAAPKCEGLKELKYPVESARALAARFRTLSYSVSRPQGLISCK